MIINIEGPSSVGKTTLTKLLRDDFEGIEVPEILEVSRPPIKAPQNEEEYFMKQTWFIEQALLRYELDNDDCGYSIFDMGIIDVLLHTIFYPLVNQKEWAVFDAVIKNLNDNFDSDLVIANKIIYLDATYETLKLRKLRDTSRLRGHHDENMLMVPHKRAFFRYFQEQHPNVVMIVNTENRRINDIREISEKFILNSNEKSEISLGRLIGIVESYLGNMN